MFTGEHPRAPTRRYTKLMSSSLAPVAQQAIFDLKTLKQRFDRSTAALPESLSTYAPVPGVMTVAQHVAHCAQVTDWFLEGAFSPNGFDLDFAPQIARVLTVQSLAAARAWLDRSLENAIAVFSTHSAESLATPLPDGPILPRQPRHAIVSALVDHTAHHRGALTVYARLNGIQPPDPFEE